MAEVPHLRFLGEKDDVHNITNSRGPPSSRIEIGSPSAQQCGIPSASIPHAVPQPEAEKGELESPECGETTVKSINSTDQGTDGAEHVVDLS